MERHSEIPRFKSLRCSFVLIIALFSNVHADVHVRRSPRPQSLGLEEEQKYNPPNKVAYTQTNERIFGKAVEEEPGHVEAASLEAVSARYYFGVVGSELRKITQGKQCVLALKNETPNNLKVFTTMVTGDQLEHFINYCSSSPSLPVLEANEDCFNAWRNSITQFGSIGMLPLMLPGWYSDTVVNTVMYNAEGLYWVFFSKVPLDNLYTNIKIFYEGAPLAQVQELTLPAPTRIFQGTLLGLDSDIQVASSTLTPRFSGASGPLDLLVFDAPTFHAIGAMTSRGADRIQLTTTLEQYTALLNKTVYHSSVDSGTHVVYQAPTPTGVSGLYWVLLNNDTMSSVHIDNVRMTYQAVSTRNLLQAAGNHINDALGALGL